MKFVCIAVVFALFSNCLAYKAVCKVPVADLLGQSITHFDAHSTAEDAYKNISVAWGVTQAECKVCPRVHQLIFNEIVDVVQEHGQEVVVDIPQVFYGYAGDHANKHNRYWMLKKNLLPLDAFSNDDAIKIPDPISFKDANIERVNASIAVLASPWHLHSLGVIYSVGTRFVVASSTARVHRVYVFDPNTKAMSMRSLARSLCVPVGPGDSKQDRQRAYVNLLHRWVCRPCGVVPYTWSGCSLQQWCPSEQFTTNYRNTLSGTLVSYWEWPACITHPRSGFDCSNLIVRAAQACSIPFYCKNTATMEAFLQELGNEPLAEGDLIWFHGHVMIVSDLARNLLIEARGYGSGHGRLHQISLRKMFKGIATYNQLIEAYRTKQPLQVLNARGSVQVVIPTFKLLRFSSCWTV